NQGLSGVEAYYDDYLSGTAGRVLTAKNAVGGDMYYEYETTFDPEPGCSLVLTIDEVIQHYLEKSLETAVKVHNVKNKACGIVLNVKTGEILAMSTKPDYDPNSPLEIFDPAVAEMLAGITDSEEYNKQLGLAQQSQWRNKAISDTYEPGSVFKIVTASTALETGAVSLNSTFYCGGSKKVGPHTMYCANHNGHGQETFLQATINSCNPAFIEIGQAIGVKNFCKYFEGFGLTEKTGVDLPGEAISQYIREEHMGIVELSSCSYGQSNSITPLQMITAAAAVVNGGYLVQPHVVKQIIDEDGSIIKSFNGETKRQVISSETSKLMAEIMEQVVLHANGRNAYVSGFRIGGKSGTSQDLGSKIVGKYWASFLGIAPVDDPEIAVLIILDYAQSKDSIYGGILAAPIVGSVMKNVLPYIGIDAVYTEEELGMLDVSVPNVTGRSITSSYAYLQPLGLSATVVGEGTEIVSQFPLAGQSVPRGSSVLLYTDATAPREVKVPDVTGRGQTEATMLFKSVGLNMRASGSGQASGQSVAPGETVAVGTVVTVEFVDHSIAD
ncbi:MAG: penicillin-binding transpeptidase domain-containing protein, partial [Oscillospiraceae bacterium]